jgi:hypothetical protein
MGGGMRSGVDLDYGVTCVGSDVGWVEGEDDLSEREDLLIIV